jgi:hypothetical protein
VVEKSLNDSIDLVYVGWYVLHPFHEVTNRHNMYFGPLLDGGLQVIKSITHLQKGPTMIIGCSKTNGTHEFT